MQNDHGQQCQYAHKFTVDNRGAERKVNMVFALTTVTMVIEIVAGSWYGSMALLADGWHMLTHSAAFAISMFVYWYARKNANNPAFTFGTGKVNALGGFASAVALGTVAFMMVIESTERLLVPESIQFNQAIAVAILGFIVNLISAVLLHDSHGHDHGHSHHHHNHNHDHSHDDHQDLHGHSHSHAHAHAHDHNLAAAYFHVLADMLTSVLAIVALILGKYYNWLWADALMGIIGSVVIAKWAYHLIISSSHMLLDKTEHDDLAIQAQKIIEQQGSQVTDLHVWKLSSQHTAMIIAISSAEPTSPEEYKQLLQQQLHIDHITVEVNLLD
ncbi:CDF family Co(II)/Ni(II) efflux transporter DmeF [Catenovulum sp. SX2]|uniref:CDF family Co(II)/Ni(II) efflux transporter DmeF n=1 Tax=Catenovulum sp. SX2 TaxID=3398614 RepID=UPI003F850735